MAAASDDAHDFEALEGLPQPRAQTLLVGHTAAEQAMLEAYRGGRIHHAWLIGGMKGTGKATLAYRFARFVLAHPDPDAAAIATAADLSLDPDHPAARKVAASSHPDLLVLARRWMEDKKRFTAGIPVDDVRRTISFFGSTAAEGGWRIAIVDPADDMNDSAANALLKILEEPPARALFLVVSHTPGRLLPTIRSRCRQLLLEPLAADAIGDALSTMEPEAGRDDILLASRLADGSLRRAIVLLRSDGIALYRAFRRLVDDLPRLDVAGLHAFADHVSKKGSDEAYDIFLDLWRDWVWRRVRGLPEPDGQPGPTTETALVSWAEVWEKVSRSAALADGLNLDRKAVVLSTFRALASATQGKM